MEQFVVDLKQHNDRDLLELQKEDCTFKFLIRASKTHEKKNNVENKHPPIASLIALGTSLCKN